MSAKNLYLTEKLISKCKEEGVGIRIAAKQESEDRPTYFNIPSEHNHLIVELLTDIHQDIKNNL